MSSDTFEIERRVVQESEIHDTLAEVETQIRDSDESFVRITVEEVSAEQHRANQKLAKAVKETDTCLVCGDPIDEGGFCGYQCLTNAGGDA